MVFWRKIVVQSYESAADDGGLGEFYNRILSYWGFMLTVAGLLAGFIYSTTMSVPSFHESGFLSVETRSTIYGVFTYLAFGCGIGSCIFSLLLSSFFAMAGAPRARMYAERILHMKTFDLYFDPRTFNPNNHQEPLAQSHDLENELQRTIIVYPETYGWRRGYMRLQHVLFDLPVLFLALAFVFIMAVMVVASGGLFTNSVPNVTYGVGVVVLITFALTAWRMSHILTEIMSRSQTRFSDAKINKFMNKSVNKYMDEAGVRDRRVKRRILAKRSDDKAEDEDLETREMRNEVAAYFQSLMFMFIPANGYSRHRLTKILHLPPRVAVGTYVDQQQVPSTADADTHVPVHAEDDQDEDAQKETWGRRGERGSLSRAATAGMRGMGDDSADSSRVVVSHSESSQQPQESLQMHAMDAGPLNSGGADEGDGDSDDSNSDLDSDVSSGTEDDEAPKQSNDLNLKFYWRNGRQVESLKGSHGKDLNIGACIKPVIKAAFEEDFPALAEGLLIDSMFDIRNAMKYHVIDRKIPADMLENLRVARAMAAKSTLSIENIMARAEQQAEAHRKRAPSASGTSPTRRRVNSTAATASATRRVAGNSALTQHLLGEDTDS